MRTWTIDWEREKNHLWFDPENSELLSPDRHANNPAARISTVKTFQIGQQTIRQFWSLPHIKVYSANFPWKEENVFVRSGDQVLATERLHWSQCQALLRSVLERWLLWATNRNVCEGGNKVQKLLASSLPPFLNLSALTFFLSFFISYLFYTY